MFGDGALTFQEFAMGEPLPLVLEFLRDRKDALLYGAQGVNAYDLVSAEIIPEGGDDKFLW